MITVMKASAGSGKTYALAEKYIRMLLSAENPAEYRHILAVTFTNKATDEMKERIITELYKIAHPEIERSTMDVPDNQAKAAAVLSNILHDYGAFAVSTIDKFFQQTLRAFARELGQFNRYEVELDKQSLVQEAVDTILDELDMDNPEDRKLVNFLVENLEESLSQGKGFNIEGALKDMAAELKSSSFTDMASALALKPEQAYSQEQLSELKKSCKQTMEQFQQKVTDSAAAVISAMKSAGLGAGDFSRKWIGALEGMDWVNGDRKLPSDSLLGKLSEPSAETWFNKKEQWRYEGAISAMGSAVSEFVDLWDKPFAVYNTAGLLYSQVYGLGIASRLFEMFARIANEKNVVCLDDSNLLLKKIIDGSDAPFIYEKTGVRYGTFMLDEFQDTSTTQWENFLPLLKESEAWKPRTVGPDGKVDDTFNNLIVGDVKQSIYRWRQGDWRLLDSKVDQAFAGSVVQSPLDKNWRSLGNIIKFNNMIYPKLAAGLDAMNVVPEGCSSVSDIYKGEQLLAKGEKQNGGTVDVLFIDEESLQLEQILRSVEYLHDKKGVSYGRIAVLVRKKVQGTEVAQMLIEKKIPVVTDASLRMKNSLSVRRLVSMMYYVDNPENKVGSYIASRYNLGRDQLAYHSLADLAETLYRVLCEDAACLADCEKEVMYVTSFMDYVMNYARTKGNNLHSFLKFWEEQDPEVNSTASENAVQIITIHKSKGLAFDYTIVPFVENISLYDSRRTAVWAVPDAKGTCLEQFSDRPYHIPLNSGSQNTLFKDEYVVEKFNQGVDAINLLYVATTRATTGLMVLAGKKSRGDSGMADMLRGVLDGKNYHVGEDVFGVMEPADGDDAVGADEVAGISQNDDAAVGDYLLSYPYYNIGERLKVRPYASDFFTDMDRNFEALPFRLRGIVMHDILSRVVVPSDLQASVEQAIASGALEEASKDEVLRILSDAIAAKPEYFPPAGAAKILCETTLISRDGSEHRPDRVLIYPDGRVFIVDYKTGTPKDSYQDQIDRYKQIFLDMGYTQVDAHLWYI